MAIKTLTENVAQVKADFKAIRDELVGKGEIIPNNTPTSQYAEIIKNMSGGNTDEAYEAGKKAQYDEFWDNVQRNGKRTNYAYAFYYWGDVGSPKYDIKPTGTAQSMFFSCAHEGDLKKRFEDCGIVLDTSQATNLNFHAQNATKITAHPTIDVSSCGGNTQSLFYTNRALVTAEIIGINESTVFTRCFLECYELQNMTFSGTIAKALDIHYSTKLTRASILSLLQGLKASVTGITITLPTNCIDGATDTLALIQSDTELNTAYTQAVANGYSIAFK